MLKQTLSIKELLAYGAKFLKDTSEIPNKEARILLAYLLKKDTLWLISHEDEKTESLEEYTALLQQRKEYEPMEYITNSAGFYGEDFYVDSRVLIPRPETEILIDMVLLASKEYKIPRIVEIGCGSGVIAIMLAKLLPQAKIIALDISQDALEVAKHNAQALHVKEKIEFIQSDLLSNYKSKSFDILVSNPPYVAKDAPLHVGLSYEPNIALFGGERGDEILQKIIDEFMQADAKTLACEMGYDQREKVAGYLTKYKLEANFYKDLAGVDRGFVLKKRA